MHTHHARVAQEGATAVISRNESQSTSPDIWKTIKLGLYKTPQEYVSAFEPSRRLKPFHESVIDATACSQEEIEVDLVLMTPRDLGFKDNQRFEDICNRALTLGIELCPAEVGLALAFQYVDQPKPECVVIAMEPIAANGGKGQIYIVEHNRDILTGPSLYSWDGNPSLVWPMHYEHRFAFVRPR